MTADVATELLPAPVVSLGVEAESRLQNLTAVSPDQPIVWWPHGYRCSGTAVRNVEHLSVLVSSLPEPGEWVVVEWSDGVQVGSSDKENKATYGGGARRCDTPLAGSLTLTTAPLTTSPNASSAVARATTRSRAGAGRHSTSNFGSRTPQQT
jgi:hypothetical protein